MRLRPPEPPAALREVHDLAAHLAALDPEDRELTGLRVTGPVGEKVDLSGFALRGVRFEGCRFAATRFARADLADVVFKGCDVSNCDFSSTSWVRCQMEGGKAMGANFSGGALWHTLFLQTNLRYANLDDLRLESVAFDGCDLSEAYLTQGQNKGLAFFECKLFRTSFFKTKLAGVDVTTCEMEAITVSDDFSELRGLKVTPFQAADLARMLGIIIS